MSGDDDNELNEQMRKLSEELTDDKVRAIADKLGLHDHERRKRVKAASPRLSEEGDGVCSFCGGSRETVGLMVVSRSGARICRKCLSAMNP